MAISDIWNTGNYAKSIEKNYSNMKFLLEMRRQFDAEYAILGKKHFYGAI